MILILSIFFHLNVKSLGFFFIQTNKYFPESKHNFTLSMAHKGKKEMITWPQDNTMLFFSLLSGCGAGMCNLQSELADAELLFVKVTSLFLL